MKSSAVEWFIAWRYLFSKKSHSIINIISVVTVVAIAVPCAAMIVVLSVYNGLDTVLKSMYSNFDPQIAVTAKEGKFFDVDSVDFSALAKIDGVQHVARIIEENALVDYKGRQAISTLRGVDSVYVDMIGVEGLIVAGEGVLELGDLDYAIPGSGVAHTLGVNVVLYDKMQLYVPNPSGQSSFLTTDFYNSREIQPAGVFGLDEETDGRYMLIPLRFAEELLGRKGALSLLGISLVDGAHEKMAVGAIKKVLGPRFEVKTRYEQKEGLYKVMAAEKLGVYFIIVMILVIASFTLVGAMIMLISEKQDSIISLKAMGATTDFVERVFIGQGMLIAVGGVVLGCVVGVGLAWAQNYFGIIAFDSEMLLIDRYPVELRLTDLVTIVATVTIVEAVIAYFTTKLSVK